MTKKRFTGYVGVPKDLVARRNLYRTLLGYSKKRSRDLTLDDLENECLRRRYLLIVREVESD